MHLICECHYIGSGAAITVQWQTPQTKRVSIPIFQIFVSYRVTQGHTTSKHLMAIDVATSYVIANCCCLGIYL